MKVRSRAAAAALALALAACSQTEEKAAASADAPAPSAELPAEPAREAASLVSATREFAKTGCVTARRELEACAACDTPEQQPLRDLLLAYCKEREAPSEARALYEAIITGHPHTEASVTAIMRVRQLDAAELPPLGAAAGPKPTPLDRPQPAYPSLAEAAGIEGRVRLRFDVLANGSVGNVRVVEATPPLLFDSVALYAVSSWRFQPGEAAPGQQVALRFDLPEAPPSAATPPAGEPAK